MGCAATLRFKLPIKAQQAGRLVKTINPQQVGGTTKVVEAGRAIVREMAEQLASVERTIVPFSALTIGTKCGASDPNSLQYCHPVVGRACDLLVEKGATVVLSEDCELIEGAGVMAKRAASPEIAAQIRAMARDVNRAWKKRFGFTLKERVVQGGMSAADWKKTSLAHAAKAGSGPITGFFDMSEIVKGPGLVILNAPNTDLECVTCLAASGCNITLFTTGRGTPVGSPIASTIKVTATRKTFETMGENIDVSVHGVADGSETLDAAAQRVVQEVLDVANGKATKAEILRHWEIAIPIRGVTF